MKSSDSKNHIPKVLIVEDDYVFSLKLEILVQEAGYELLANVDNSGEALDLRNADEILHKCGKKCC